MRAEAEVLGAEGCQEMSLTERMPEPSLKREVGVCQAKQSAY